MMIAALPFFVYARTGEPLAAGGMFAVMSLPCLLFGSVAGVLGNGFAGVLAGSVGSVNVVNAAALLYLAAAAVAVAFMLMPVPEPLPAVAPDRTIPSLD